MESGVVYNKKHFGRFIKLNYFVEVCEIKILLRKSYRLERKKKNPKCNYSIGNKKSVNNLLITFYTDQVLPTSKG